MFLLIVAALNAVTHGSGNTNTSNSNTQQQAQATTAPAQKPTATPTPQVVHYPPKTKADLQGLAAKGDASALSVLDSQSTGLTGVCPQPRVDAVVSTTITGEQLAKDMLAYFYRQNMDTPCGSVLFVYYSKADYNAGNGYTAGRILLDTTDASGQSNTDPNATNITYTVTLDTGSALGAEQEYVVTY